MDSSTKTKSLNEKSSKKVQIIESKKSIWDEFQKDEKSYSTTYLLNKHYSTPQPIKLPKPSQKAFFSDGYESKKKKTRQSYQHTPKTPSKQYTLNSFNDINLLTPTPNRLLKFTENSINNNSNNGYSFSSPSSPTKSRSNFEPLFSPNSDSSLSSPLPFCQSQFTINQNFDDPQGSIATHKVSYKNTSRILDKEYVEKICKSHIEKDISTNVLQDDYLGNNFVDKHVIGHGSFAVVYKVKDLKDNKYYAVKVAKNPFHGEKDRINQLEEVNIWWEIGNNDNCVQLHQAWEQNGILHLQLDLCNGGSLQDYLETTGLQSTLPESQIWKILLDICKGLEHVHKLNIVHLDIKPANIFIKKSEDGKLVLKIGDFGLARKCPVPPNTGLEGDKVYLAPEVLGDDGYETSADIFSLGLILVEMASNTYLPDTGVYWQDLRKGNITLCENLEHASNELLDLIKKMIDPNPKLRPTATEVMKVAEEQIKKYSDNEATISVDIDLLDDLPSSSSSSLSFPSLSASTSSSFAYTLSSSSSFIEEDDNIELVDNTKPIKNKKNINEKGDDTNENGEEKDEENDYSKRVLQC
jgi:serine/threonine protein kinase